MNAAAAPPRMVGKIMLIETIIPLIILSANAVWDVFRKEILLSSVLVMGAAGVIYRGFYLSEGIAGVFTALLPGAFLLAVSLISNGRIGKGDALLSLSLGEWLGLSDGVFVIFLASAGAAAAAAVLWSAKKKDAEIPFVPFMLSGYVLKLILLYTGSL